VITTGEFSQDVGGGANQVARTFFNAVFFGGYRIVSHPPHSYYIKRYPMGREATVFLPAPTGVRQRQPSWGPPPPTPPSR
jgi:vancomycin resistance protein YoaR